MDRNQLLSDFTEKAGELDGILRNKEGHRLSIALRQIIVQVCDEESLKKINLELDKEIKSHGEENANG